MFQVVEDSLAREIESSARTKGLNKQVLANLDAFYPEWREENPEGTFIVQLNDADHAPFNGKKTESLYSGLQTIISGDETLKANWRLIKRKLVTNDMTDKQKSEVEATLFIAHL